MKTLNELMDLRGRDAVITGAMGGLGRAMAAALAEMGANLVLVDRSGDGFTELKDVLSKWNVEITFISCDLEQEGQRADLITQIRKDRCSLDILVNNAAFVGTSDLQGWAVPFEQQSVETWKRALEVNLTAVFDLCQGLMPLLKQSAAASVVNIGSIYGVLGPDWGLYEGTQMSNPAAYGASKGGLLQLTRWLATTVAPQVRVNAISPGGIARQQPGAFVRRYEEKVPLRRMATEADFCGAIAYLASDMSRYVTGQNLIVDGGWSAW
ncbi:SDR family oxidoreductase [Herbaspirillum sp. NPDC101397]|uniref:SDR family oxidoreductase n=1 Tax=Herbaspirillum sp. NPDC101397 TaxID=3364006 RepID=UPI00383AA84A